MDRTPRSTEALVELQVKRWATSPRAKAKPEETPHRWPVIAISREYGARGAAIGERVAQRLGFDFWDQKFVHTIAESSGMSTKVIASLDEQRRNAFSHVFATIFTGGITSSGYVERLFRIIHTVSSHGGAVLIGRGANFLLRPESCLRVRVVMPFAERVRGIMERRGLSEREARDEVTDTDADRHAFIRQTYDTDVSDTLAYDLTINSGFIPVEPAVDVVIAAYTARFGRPPAPLA